MLKFFWPSLMYIYIYDFSAKGPFKDGQKTELGAAKPTIQHSDLFVQYQNVCDAGMS